MGKYQDDDQLFFTDIRGMHQFDTKTQNKKYYNESKVYESNFGAGYRKIINEELVGGLAAYFDYRKSSLYTNKYFSQVTINTHLLSDKWQGNLNFYIPVGKKKLIKNIQNFTGQAKAYGHEVVFLNTKQALEEKQLTGVDLRISNVLPNNEKLRLGGIFYGFNSKIIGGGLTAKYEINDNITLEGQATYDRVQKTNIIGGIRFTLPYDRRKVKNYSKKDKLFATKVERDVDIVTNKNFSKPEIVEVKQQNIIAVDSKLFNTTSSNSGNLNKLFEYIKNHKGEIHLVLTDGSDKAFTYNESEKLNPDEVVSIIAKYKEHNLKAMQDVNLKSTRIQEYQAMSHLHKILFLVGIDAAKQEYKELLLQKYLNNHSTYSKKFTVDIPGYNNAIIERAGVLVISHDENNNKVIILGTDANSIKNHNGHNTLPYSTWFTGQADSIDNSFYDTIIREGFEESSTTLPLTQQDIQQAINENLFFYDPVNKTFAVIYVDKSNKYSDSYFNQALSKIKNDPKIPSAMKEIAQYYAVPVDNIKLLANRVINNLNINRINPIYNVQTNNNLTLRIEHHYANTLRSPQAIPALNNAIRKLSN